MNKFSIRLSEMSKLPENVRSCEGYFYNENQDRIELRIDGRMICFVSLELLKNLWDKGEEVQRQVISGSPSPMWKMLANFYFPEWQFHYHLKTGEVESGYL